MQKRLVRKLDLEVLLSRIEPHPTPRASLEQYTISASVASTLLYIAAYANNSIIDKTVLDLGCGTGRLALGAAFLGARQVVGVDIDKIALKVAVENSARIGLKGKVQWVATDVDALHGHFDTVLQNPPYGIQTHLGDRKFLEKALEMGKIVYSLHKSWRGSSAFAKRLETGSRGALLTAPSPFLRGLVEKRGGKIQAVYSMVMTIPHMFSFHTRKKHKFIVDLCVIEKPQ